jgi:Exostosin family
VLLDIETCHETNYPSYYSARNASNMDSLGGRTLDYSNGGDECAVAGWCGRLIGAVLDSPLFRQVNASTLLYLDCRGDDPDDLKFRQTHQTSRQLSVAAIDALDDRLLKDVDMGLPPPAVNPISLSNPQRQAILTCDSEAIEHRPYLLTFVGSIWRGPVRQHLSKLHNGNDVIILGSDDIQNETFASLLQKSSFAATPRGDNLFSYRFTEALSAGAVPVVHADSWRLPFHPKLVDWSKCAVVIPERQYNQTLDILRRISRDERCRMRQYCYEVYHKYLANPEANMAGLIQSLEVMQKRE